MRILAIKWRKLGDTILWTSALEALREHYPGAEIDIAYPAPYREVFEADTRFHSQFPLSDKDARSVTLVTSWRKRSYDLAVNFHASSRTALLAIGAGAKERVIHHHSRTGKNFFSSRPIPNLGKPMPATERDLNVVRALGWNGKSPATRVLVPKNAREAALTRLRSLGWREEPLVVLGISASRPAKEWPLEYFAKAIELAPEPIRMAIVYDSESAFRNQPSLRDRMARRAWLLHTPRLTEVMGLLSWASGYAGSDSGLKHLACALGVPTTTLFGPESVGEWHCYDLSRHRVLQKKVACRSNDSDDAAFAWCGVETCPLGSHACLSLISPEEMAAELTRMLG